MLFISILFSLLIQITFAQLSPNWIWISGSDLVNQNGTYGTKGVASSSNVPGGRDGAASWKDLNNNLWLFGGFGRDATGINTGYLNDLWKFDGVNWTWISGSNITNQYGNYGTKGIASSSNVPGARSNPISWTDSNNLWLFGGYGYTATGAAGSLNDLWKFNGTNWIWISGSNIVNQRGTYGTKGIASSSNIPGARINGVSWTDLNNLWLFGGFGYDAAGSFGYLNDLWEYDGMNWTWISGSNSINQPGNYGTKGIASSLNIPGARFRAVSWKDSNNNFWLFGGQGFGSGYLNDLWKYDGMNWTWISGSNSVNQNGNYGNKGIASSSNIPGGRANALAWTDSNGTLWLFGGFGYPATGINTGYLNDLWKFDRMNWTWILGPNSVNQRGTYGTKGIASSSNIPSSRSAAVTWKDSNNNFWLFGGSGYASIGTAGYLNDLWKFEFPPPITTGFLTSNSLTTSPVTTSPVTTSPITSAGVTTNELTTSPITSARVTTSELTTSPITSAEVTTNELTTSPITSAELTTNELTTSPITSARVTSNELTTSPITSAELSTSPLSTGEIGSAEFTTGDLNSISTQEISNGIKSIGNPITSTTAVILIAIGAIIL